MIETLKQWDTTLFLFLNGFHNSFFDVIMFWMSKGWFWIPVYLLFFYFVVKYYKKQTIFILLAYALLVTLTDQVSAQVFKNAFHRFRPSHEPALEGLVHIVNGYRGGDYGFVSSHACNFFGIITFTIFLLKGKVKYLPLLLVIWAIFICYTRIYLGVHYPGDILCGAIVGSGIGIGVSILYAFLSAKYFLKKEKKI
jgi:undecaprenyl-diphosphatase